MKQQVEQGASSFEEKLETAKGNGLIFGNLYKFLKDPLNPDQQQALIKLFEDFQRHPFAKKKIRSQIERLVDFNMHYEPTEEELAQMDLVDLYYVRKSILDNEFRGLCGRLKAIADCLKIKYQILKAAMSYNRRLKKVVDQREIHELHADVVKNIVVGGLEELGLHFELDYNDCNPEDINANPYIFLMNHQGGGMETCVIPYIFNHQYKVDCLNRIVVKSNFKKTPFMGNILTKLEAIFVDRPSLNNQKTRKQELESLAAEMVRTLVDGKSLILFPEGTRSADGNVAGSPARLKWAKEINGLVDQAIQKRPTKKILVLADSLLGYPSPIENFKTVIDDQFRKNAGIKFKFFHLPEDLKFEDNPDDPYDCQNFFGFARKNLADMQREEIRKLLAEEAKYSISG